MILCIADCDSETLLHLEYGIPIMFTYRYLSVNCLTKIDLVEFGLGWANYGFWTFGFIGLVNNFVFYTAHAMKAYKLCSTVCIKANRQ